MPFALEHFLRVILCETASYIIGIEGSYFYKSLNLCFLEFKLLYHFCSLIQSIVFFF